eukprot:Nitzschia sp. Nitz4//scaffold117_size69655//55221//57435//NITZ4_006027-RA/size69655-augustus-gene-0.7-mRNA-1//-1//CDS//3329533660//7614//frame0
MSNPGYLWGDDESTGVKSRGGGSTNLSGARFSTRDFSVDQSVNLMAMGGDQNTNLSGTSASRGSITGLFRADAKPGGRLDEFGDAAPSGESEEFISDKHRRVSPIGASVFNLIQKFCEGTMMCCVRLGVNSGSKLALAIVGVCALFYAVRLVVPSVPRDQRQLQNYLINAGVTSRGTFSGDTPQRAAIEWLIDDDTAQVDTDDMGFLDRYVLAVFYFSSTNPDEWTNKENWMTPAGICSWAGIECNPITDEETQEVITSYDANHIIKSFVLESNNMEGTLPSEISKLYMLTSLSLSDNNLSGTVPEAWSDLDTVQTLSLRKNALTGSFPICLTTLPSLIQLNLGHNQFDGSLPTTLANLRQIRSLSLSSNSFTGEIPDISDLESLASLYMESNKFSGTLPDWLPLMTNLRDLRLNENSFTGTFPEAFKHLVNLAVLHLDTLSLVGTVPNIFDDLYRLSDLQLHQNKFTGSLPGKLWHLTSLKTVTLDNNEFSGTLSGNIGTLEDLEGITLHANKLTGSIPTHVGNLDDVRFLSLANNEFTGTIPTEVGECHRLTTLRFESNKLTGSIPTEIGDLEKLLELKLEYNQLSGTSVPTEICKLVEREDLDHLSADCESKVSCECCSQCF